MRCENAASLSVQVAGAAPCMIAPGMCVSAPRFGDSEPTVVIASDLAGNVIAALELRENLNGGVSSGSNNGASDGINSINNNNNTSRAAGKPPAALLTFNMGADPNTLTGFFCADGRVQVAVGDGAAPADVEARSVVSLANGSRAVIRVIDALGAVIAQAAVEGNRSACDKNLADFWAQLDAALISCPDAANMRSLRPGSSAWLDELARVVRALADPKRTFEIRFRASPGAAGSGFAAEAITVESAGYTQRCTESESIKVFVADRVAVVAYAGNPSALVMSAAMMNAIESSANSADADAMRAATAAVAAPAASADERLQMALGKYLRRLKEEAAKLSAKAAPIRFTLPRGCTMRNLRCDKPDAVLYATVAGRRDRLSPGEAMPPPSLVSTAESVEIEACLPGGACVGSIICSFASDTRDACVAFDCELIPDGDEAVMNLTAPSGYQILPRVDGLKGASLGSRGVVRLDPFASHVVQVILEDAAGASVLSQTFFLPRISLPRIDVGVDDASISVSCPRGIKVLASVDGGPERTTDAALPIDCDRPHSVALTMLADSLSRGGAREMCRAGQVQLKLPPLLGAHDVLELLRLLKDHDPSRVGTSPVSGLPPRLSLLATRAASQTVREISCVIASIAGAAVGGGGGGGGYYSGGGAPSAPAGGGGSGSAGAAINTNSTATGGARSRSETPQEVRVITFNLLADPIADDMMEAPVS